MQNEKGKTRKTMAACIYVSRETVADTLDSLKIQKKQMQFLGDTCLWNKAPYTPYYLQPVAQCENALRHAWIDTAAVAAQGHCEKNKVPRVLSATAVLHTLRLQAWMLSAHLRKHRPASRQERSAAPSALQLLLRSSKETKKTNYINNSLPKFKLKGVKRLKEVGNQSGCTIN